MKLRRALTLVIQKRRRAADLNQTKDPNLDQSLAKNPAPSQENVPDRANDLGPVNDHDPDNANDQDPPQCVDDHHQEGVPLDDPCPAVGEADLSLEVLSAVGGQYLDAGRRGIARDQGQLCAKGPALTRIRS